jgi:hypothetical protein
MTKKLKFDNDLDGERLDPLQMSKASNETLIANLADSEDPNVIELVRRFCHAVDCLAYPSMYHKIDVEGFVKGEDTSLLPRTKKS